MTEELHKLRSAHKNTVYSRLVSQLKEALKQIAYKPVIKISDNTLEFIRSTLRRQPLGVFADIHEEIESALINPYGNIYTGRIFA